MPKTYPGTTIEVLHLQKGASRILFDGIFATGGITLSQVSVMTGLEPYMIQNWVKRGFLPPPRNKRYDMEQLCRLVNINILKGTMPLEQIIRLMAYLNGDLADEQDDLVDDTMLFFLFVRLVICPFCVLLQNHVVDLETKQSRIYAQWAEH